MVKREEINGFVCIAQTTFYIYKDENALQNDEIALVITSDKKTYNCHKRELRKCKNGNT